MYLVSSVVIAAAQAGSTRFVDPDRMALALDRRAENVGNVQESGEGCG